MLGQEDEMLSTTELSKLTGTRQDNVKRVIDRFRRKKLILEKDVVQENPVRIRGLSAYTVMFNCNPCLYADWMKLYHYIPSIKALKSIANFTEDRDEDFLVGRHEITKDQ